MSLEKFSESAFSDNLKELYKQINEINKKPFFKEEHIRPKDKFNKYLPQLDKFLKKEKKEPKNKYDKRSYELEEQKKLLNDIYSKHSSINPLDFYLSKEKIRADSLKNKLKRAEERRKDFFLRIPQKKNL